MEHEGKKALYSCIYAGALALITGCFSPTATDPGIEQRIVVERQTVTVPYDILWDSALKVLDSREFVIFDSNPDEGTVTGEVRGLATGELECASAPGSDGLKPLSATTMFNLVIRPQGHYASTLEFSESTEGWVETFHGVMTTWCSPRPEAQRMIVDRITRLASATRRPTFVRRGD